jgi:hypothetical protein
METRVEEIPGSTPEQEELRRRGQRWLTIGTVAGALTLFALGLGELLTPIFWVAAAAGLVLAVSIVGMIAIARELQRSGPPFEHLRWWWPRRR